MAVGKKGKGKQYQVPYNIEAVGKKIKLGKGKELYTPLCGINLIYLSNQAHVVDASKVCEHDQADFNVQRRQDHRGRL